MKVEINSLAWFDKADLQPDQLKYLTGQLTLTQKVSQEYQKRSKPAIVHLWSSDENGRMGIPREFFLSSVRKTHEITYSTSRGDPWPDRKLITTPEIQPYVSDDASTLTLYDTEENREFALRPEQREALAAVKEKFTGHADGGLIQAPTGWGKTTIGLAVIREMKVKTAVVVHRTFLMNQWKDKIRRFMPDAKIGTIAGDTWETDDCHVVIVMIETIASWAKKGKLPPELSGMFGLVIYDEIHRVGAPMWSLAVPAFNSAYRLGISAHPRRSDGLDKVFFYHIGEKIYTGVALSVTPKIRRVYSNYSLKTQWANPSFMSMEWAFKLMAVDDGYNQDVVDQIKLALDKGRKIFVYSHKVDHLRTMRKMVDEQYKTNPIVTDMYIGGMDEEELKKSEKADCIFGTFQMAKDSLDIPALDTVVLAGPIRNPTQPAGRCCREYLNKKDPVVVDMRADNVPIFRSYGESRDRVYEKIYVNKDAAQQPLVKDTKDNGEKA